MKTFTIWSASQDCGDGSIYTKLFASKEEAIAFDTSSDLQFGESTVTPHFIYTREDGELIKVD